MLTLRSSMEAMWAVRFDELCSCLVGRTLRCVLTKQG